jgi:O-antigen/teichoic acid export membrane protein
MWQVLNRLIGYISPASGRPTQALKWTLANQQSSTDYDQKRRYVGSTVAVWTLFLPLMIVLGGLLAWFAPYWLKAPAESFWYVRLAAGILVVNLAMFSLAEVPQSVLEGENLGYKRIGLTVGLVFVGGGLTWLALYLHMGIVGVAAAALLTTLLTGLLFLGVVRAYAPWFGIARPSRHMLRRFLSLSWWFLGWNLVMNLMMSSDIVVLGLLDSVESVTAYSLSKYAPETAISVVAIMVFGSAPGLGGIIGTGNLVKAAKIRGEIMSLTWLVVAVLGTTVLLWNRAFVTLWVGSHQYIGTISVLLIVLLVIQFVFIRNDANVIDLTLRLRHKVLLGFLSVALSLAAAAVLVGYFKLGTAGLCVGLIAGRLILSLGYPLLVGRLLQVPFRVQLSAAPRPALATALLFSVALGLDRLMFRSGWGTAIGWIGLALSVTVTFGLASLVAFYTGLSRNQRANIVRRVRAVAAIGRS